MSWDVIGCYWMLSDISKMLTGIKNILTITNEVLVDGSRRLQTLVDADRSW
jgi:hypothetical protein